MITTAVQTELTDIILSFLEVAVHTLLFVRGLYPAAIFEKRKEYGVGVWMSRYPGLNASIVDALAAIKPLLLKNTVESVLLVFLDQGTGSAIEQYAFDVSTALPTDVPATYSDVELSLGSCLTRLMLLEGALPALPKGTTFTLMISTHELLLGQRQDQQSSGRGGSSGSRTGGISGDGSATDPGSPWARVGDTDPSARLQQQQRQSRPGGVDGSGGGQEPLATGKAAFKQAGMLLKSVRAGTMGIDIRLARVAASTSSSSSSSRGRAH